MIKEYKPEDLIQAAHAANKLAEDAVEPMWKAEMLREDSKDVLAREMTEIKETRVGVKISEVELERLARSTVSWMKYRTGQFQAMREAASAKVKAQNAKLLFDSIQSGMSYEKERMKRAI